MMKATAAALVLALPRTIAQEPSPYPTQPPVATSTALESCDLDTSCPNLYYCDSVSGGIGECRSCALSASAGPYGCINNDDLTEERCINECSTLWTPCSEDAPCPSGFFCASEEGDEGGYCFACNRVNDPLVCYSYEGWDLSPEARGDCASTCFQACEGDNDEDRYSCADGSFCNFQQESSGYCSDCQLFGSTSDCSSHPLTDEGSQSCLESCFGCSTSETCPRDEWFCDYELGPDGGYCKPCQADDPKYCTKSWVVPEAAGSIGQESCLNTCFDGCSSDNPCPGGSFCDYQEVTSGYCSNCEIFRSASDCTNSWSRPATDEGSQSCLESCFACSASRECQRDNYFCDYEPGSDDGYCRPCAEDPEGCTEASGSAGQESCLSTCFNECSSDNACSERSFCTSSDFGLYCFDCDKLYKAPSNCLYQELSNEMERVCLSTCFEDCSLGSDECDDYCEDVLGNSETGYCAVYTRGMGRPPSGGCKFCPSMSEEEITELLEQTALPTPSPVQGTKEGVSASPFLNATTDAGGNQQETVDTSIQTTTPTPSPEHVTNEHATSPPSTTLVGSVKSDRVSCDFCQSGGTVQYPDREIRTFYGITCSDMNTKIAPALEADSRDCRVAKSQQHICGCSDNFIAYAGANTHTKRAVLTWLPRCSALLSTFGSAIIIADIASHRKRRQKTFGQLMILLSSFDLLASVAYAFTSFPIPAEDYIYGGHGTKATCTAQAFFVSLGSVACYTNVSLAFYYLFMLKLGWSEHKVKKARPWLIVVPLTIGLAFSFAGIPFYDSIILWCSNTGNFWSDIPVAGAILIATVVMGIICYHVYREEQASSRWRSRGAGAGAGGEKKKKKQSMASLVAWQSVWYLASFYMVWPAYLALQFLWASGKAYNQYGFILFAGTMVPLQGFFNCWCYLRPRMKRSRKRSWLRTVVTKFTHSMHTTWMSSKNESNMGSRVSTPGTNVLTEGTSEEHKVENGDGNNSRYEEAEANDANLSEYVSLFANEQK